MSETDIAAIQDSVSKLSIATPIDDVKVLFENIRQTECDDIDKLHFNEFLLPLLKSGSADLKIEVAKVIAELTKTDDQRKMFTKTDTVHTFVAELNSAKKVASTDLQYLIQVSRALGNIVYMNKEARKMVNAIDGEISMISLWDLDEKGKPEGPNTQSIVDQFLSVRSGLISNYISGGDIFSKRCLELGLMTKIQRYIVKASKDVVAYEELLLHTLGPVSILTETVFDMNFEDELNKALVHILAQTKNPDVAEMCLDLLHYQAENDGVKLVLAKEGLCETIYKLLEQYKAQANDSDARALMKLACELIVLILTGDEAMHYLYTTPLLKYIEEWLDSDDVELLSTGVLALGNFARTDTHCINMVEQKVMHKLLDILSKNNGKEDDMRIQHALLSTLRNIVIPKENKAAVIEAGLVETILPMLQIHEPPVVFKLLGTLRMTVDGQEKLAIELLQNETLIKQLVLWSKSSDFANVTGESLRLMAWLIKHGYMHSTKTENGKSADSTPKDPRQLEAFVRTEGAVQCMVDMLKSQHLVMQNEAMIALSLLFAVIGSKNKDTLATGEISLNALYIEYDLGANMVYLISKNVDKMTKEIVDNLNTFVALLQKSPDLAEHFEKHKVNEELKKIPVIKELCTL